MKENRHKGLREFTGDESSNLFLGQNGFKIITNATIICNSDTAENQGETVTSGYENIKYFVALKAIDVNCEVEARTMQGVAGDELTLHTSGSADFSSPVSITNGDTVYGCFDKIEVPSADFVIAYIGRNSHNP